MSNDSGNLFEGIPAALEEELVERIAGGEGVRIERIVSRAHASPEGFWYDQDEEELVVLLKGSACLRFEGERGEVTLGPGDYLRIPAHARHRVEWTDADADTVWLAVFY
jgi:cupin 2 domain-containing protein